MERAKILDALHDTLAGKHEAVLVIDHLPPRHFRFRGDLIGPARDIRESLWLEEAARHQEAIPLEGGQFSESGAGSHASSCGTTTRRAVSTSTGKSISIQGRPLMSS